MRVIGGSARGMHLKGPPSPRTRATSDKVRGAIFNILAPRLDGAHVLDLYAGTGALGIEALSRGAATCLFVEQARAACRVIEANLRTTQLSDRATVWCMTVEAALNRLERGKNELHSTFMAPYDVIMLDPPYEDPEIAGVIARAGRFGMLAQGGFVVFEHSKRREPPREVGELSLLRTRLYGDTAVTVWQQSDVDQPRVAPEVDSTMRMCAFPSDQRPAVRRHGRPRPEQQKAEV